MYRVRLFYPDAPEKGDGSVVSMTNNPQNRDVARDASRPPASRTLRAARAPTPRACGCGRTVAFDVEKREFFCIGCGAARQCLCLRSRVSGLVRPVNVA